MRKLKRGGNPCCHVTPPPGGQFCFPEAFTHKLICGNEKSSPASSCFSPVVTILNRLGAEGNFWSGGMGFCDRPLVWVHA